MLHLLLHFLVPAIVAWFCFRRQWLRTFILLSATMLVDLDHLLATPIYDPNRCSIGFHPLHTAVPITIYLLLILPARTRVIGLGLAIHMLLDSLDCQLTNGI